MTSNTAEEAAVEEAPKHVATRWDMAAKPQAFLDAIENDEEAFLEGNRNNDVVNWALASIMVFNVEHKEDDKTLELSQIIDQWDKFVDARMTAGQVASINDWEEYPEDKLASCIKLYSDKTNSFLAFNKVIDRGGYAGYEY